MRNLSGAAGAAIQHFWTVRAAQGQRQGEKSGTKDTGSRAMVTAGKQMSGFIDLLSQLIEEEGLDRSFLHFPLFPIFEAASYLDRYDIFCTRLVRERLYDSACLLTSTRDDGLNGVYREPNKELSLFSFAASLQGRIHTAVKRFQK